MKCRILSPNGDMYYHSFVGEERTKEGTIIKTIHWTYRYESKLFDSILDARKEIKKYNLKNVEIEKEK